jgi:glutathione synthase/RimK-type ligase-like ATP-grasp enzyme
LQDAGIDAVMAAWRGGGTDWREPVPTLLRSTWDYLHAVEEFGRWIDVAGAAAPLWNAPELLHGNLHKRYLLRLAERGVPVTPTVLLPRGVTRPLSEVAAERGWRDVVLKPAIGAASFETHRLGPFLGGTPAPGERAWAAADALCARLVASHDMLVQPYLPSVEDHGERALVWIDGEFTHAVRKTPRFADGVEQVSEALPISAAERATGNAALAGLESGLLYARVDVAPGPDGMPVVMELELIEPSLFLAQSPAALARLVAAVARRL